MSAGHDHGIWVTDKNDSRYKTTRNVTLVGAVVNLFLSVAQLVGGVFTQSQALIADGVHTLSDLASDVVVLIAAKLASKDADEDHPYGHGRIETVATIILGLMLAGVATGISLDAFERLMHPERLLRPEPLGLFFAALAIVSKEGLYHYTRVAAHRVQSKMLLANAWHHRSDAISSIVVLVGIAGTVLLNIRWLDALAAILVSAMILYMGLRLILDSFSELVDKALDPDKVNEIQSVISDIEGVRNLHMLRTRQMGGRGLADVHIQVDSFISVSEGHHIAERVMQKIQKQFVEIKDITVHIDPEDDETSSPCWHLPVREELLAELEPKFAEQGFSGEIDNIVLHYLDGKIDMEVYLKSTYSSDKLEALGRICETAEAVDKVKIYSTGSG